MRPTTPAILALLVAVTPVATFTAALEQTVTPPANVREMQAPVDRPAEVQQAAVVKSTAVARRLASLFRSRATVNPRAVRGEDRREVICGLTIVRKSPDLDPRIIVPPDRGANLPARRVEPAACRPAGLDRP